MAKRVKKCARQVVKTYTHDSSNLFVALGIEVLDTEAWHAEVNNLLVSNEATYKRSEKVELFENYPLPLRMKLDILLQMIQRASDTFQLLESVLPPETLSQLKMLISVEAADQAVKKINKMKSEENAKS